MNTQQAELYQRLQAFAIDDPDANFSFSQRLARDNGWTIKFAQRAIEEYKRFAFLAVVAGHPVTPSDQVDQVWHLHLTYTRSYWGKFCSNVLQMPLHHGPTRSGQQERDKFNDWYARTIASYTVFFGAPPADLWPPSHTRFGRDLRFIRLNTEQHWVISKPQLPRLKASQAAIASLIAATGLLTGCEAVNSLLNPLNFSGSQFLQFYGCAFIVAIVLTLGLRSLVWSATRRGVAIPSLPAYEVAYLAGGASRSIDVAIANLIQQQHLQPVDGSRSLDVKTPLTQPAHPLEVAVMRSVETRPNRPVWSIHSSVLFSGQAATDAIAQRLKDLGLLPTTRQAMLLRLTALPIFALLLLGAAKILVGMSRGKPIGYLTIACFILLWIGGALLQIPFRTPQGDRYLQRLKTRMPTRSSNSDADLNGFLLQFALLGTIALPNVLQDLWVGSYPTAANSDSGSSGGIGIEAGGCGGDGGGCGGCGGCGGG